MKKYRLVFVLFAFVAMNVWSERLPDLYQYKTLVASSSKNSQEYRQAMVDGLAEVILRASGDIATLQNPGIIDALSRPTRYLLQDYFENANETIEIDGKQVPARRLVLEFSSEAILKLLREFQLPIWPNNRRSVLVWMVVDNAQGQQIVTELSFADVLTATRANAKRRGLPLLLPLMDLEDQIALTPKQLWSIDRDAIHTASERYNPDTILVGRLSQTSRGDWRSDWQLFVNDQVEIFDTQGEKIEDIVAAGLDAVANYFFQRYAINPQLSSSQGQLLFQVGNIRNFSDYMKVLSYLEQLTLIRHVDLAAVRGDELLLYLTADGNVKLLQDTLALDGKLSPREPISNAAPLGSTENPLLYAWRP